MTVRYTPFLDGHGITLKEDKVSDWAANVLDSALAAVEAMTDWGTYEGKRRRPCPEQPLLLAGAPIGQYHCPFCGMMIMAGVAHLEPGATDEQKNHPEYPLYDYEVEYGQPWPAGYDDTP